MIDLTKPLQTKSGLKVRKVLATDYKGPFDRSLIVLLETRDGKDLIQTYLSDGTCYDVNMELINVPEEVQINQDMFLNVYRDETGEISLYLHPSVTLANVAALGRTNRIACVPFSVNLTVKVNESL